MGSFMPVAARLGFVGLLLVGCGDRSVPPPPVESVPSSALESIRDRGFLTMVSFPHQANRFVHPQLDKLREAGLPLVEAKSADYYDGFDVALMRGFAEHLGVTLEIEAITTSYAEIIDSLLAGKGDVIASGMTQTPARAARVDFSEPYAESWVCVISRRSAGIHQLDDLAGLTGAVMRGSSHQELMQQRMPEGVELKLNDFKLENVIDVIEGECRLHAARQCGPARRNLGGRRGLGGGFSLGTLRVSSRVSAQQ